MQNKSVITTKKPTMPNRPDKVPHNSGWPWQVLGVIIIILAVIGGLTEVSFSVFFCGFALGIILIAFGSIVDLLGEATHYLKTISDRLDQNK